MAKKTISNTFTVNTVVDGESGDTPQQIFYRNPNNQAPETPATSQSDTAPSGWSATPQGVSSVYRYEWVSMRIKSGGVWGAYSKPAIYAYYAEDGTSISIKGVAIEMAQGTWPDILEPYEQDLSTTSIGDVILFDETEDRQAGAQKIERVLPFIEDEEEKHFVVEAVNVGDGYLIVSKDGQASDEGHLYMATDYDDSSLEYFFWQDCGRIKGEKGDDGVSFFMTSSANSVKIAANERTAPFTGTFSLFKKIGEGEPVAYEACYSAYRRKGNTYALLSSTNMKSATYQVVTTADMSYDAIVVFAFNSQYAGASPHTQNYVAKSEVLIAKDADLTQPNILKRTVFDYGVENIKDGWQTLWQCVSIPTNTPDTDVQGRLSVRINASLLTSPQAGNFVDFAQNVYGRLKPSTWYTLSFYSFSTHQFSTFLWSGTGSYVIDYNAGWYIDGVYSSGSSSIGGDGQVSWPADWTGKRHTITFKTVSSFPTQNFIIIFRTYYISTEQDRAQTAICMPKLELGQVATEYIPNEDDQRGKTGRFFYYSGFDWNPNDNTHTFPVNNVQVPYFSKAGSQSNQYYLFNPDVIPSGGVMTMAQMAAATTSGGSINWNSKPWEVMTSDFKYIITQALFAAYAHLGSWIFNGDYMLSEKDADNNPRGDRQYQGMDSSQLTTGFIPSIAFDASNGRASFGGDKVRFQPDGSGWLANKGLQWTNTGALTLTNTSLNEENENIRLAISDTSELKIEVKPSGGSAFSPLIRLYADGVWEDEEGTPHYAGARGAISLFYPSNTNSGTAKLTADDLVFEKTVNNNSREVTALIAIERGTPLRGNTTLEVAELIQTTTGGLTPYSYRSSVIRQGEASFYLDDLTSLLRRGVSIYSDYYIAETEERAPRIRIYEQPISSYSVELILEKDRITFIDANDNPKTISGNIVVDKSFTVDGFTKLNSGLSIGSSYYRQKTSNNVNITDIFSSNIPHGTLLTVVGSSEYQNRQINLDGHKMVDKSGNLYDYIDTGNQYSRRIYIYDAEMVTSGVTGTWLQLLY